ncbi:MAG: hypothetical protein WCA22_02770 [Candidatus Binatus sp.]
MTLLQRLIAKQKADAERREARLEQRREYARLARERAQQSGLDDLPPEVAVALEELPTAQPEPAPVPVQHDPTPEELVSRLEAIKDRLFRLHAVFAVSLSHDCAMEANRYLEIFQELASELKKKDPQALERIVAGHEAMLNSPPIQMKQTIPLDTQRWCEIRWEASQSPIRHAPKRPADNVPDGLGWML